MASYFLDSSAVVKRYHWEVGSGWVRAICNPRNHPRLYLSALARVEVVAGLRRTGRNEMLHPSYVDAMVNIFRRQLALSDHARQEPVYNLVPMSDAVLRLAANLCDR